MWYVCFPDKESGPFTWEQMQKLVGNGHLKPVFLVRHESGNWTLARMLPELNFHTVPVVDAGGIATRCRCGHEFRAPKSFAGMVRKCPKCLAQCRVPVGEEGFEAIDSEVWRGARVSGADAPVLFRIWTVIVFVMSVLGMVGSAVVLFLPPPAMWSDSYRTALATNLAQSIFWLVAIWALRRGQAWAWYAVQCAWGITLAASLFAAGSGREDVIVLVIVQAILIGACWINLHSEDVKAYCSIE